MSPRSRWRRLTTTLFRDAPSRPERKDYSESQFAFLQRVDQPFWARVRALVETWFADFPADRRNHIEDRLRSPDYRQFAAGFWELYLYQLLKGAGLQVEVLKEASDRTPDFRVTAGSKSCFIEATLVSGVSDVSEQAERRRNVLLDALDEMTSDKFTLDVHVDADGDDLPPVDDLKKAVTEQLEELDRLQVTSSHCLLPCTSTTRSQAGGSWPPFTGTNLSSRPTARSCDHGLSKRRAFFSARLSAASSLAVSRSLPSFGRGTSRVPAQSFG